MQRQFRLPLGQAAANDPTLIERVDLANLLIIVITVLVLGGSARYIRGHWF